jgi:hypothetical protein
MSAIATSAPIPAGVATAAMTSIYKPAMMRPRIPPTTCVATTHVTAIRIAWPPRWVRSTKDDPPEQDDKAYCEQAKKPLGTRVHRGFPPIENVTHRHDSFRNLDTITTLPIDDLPAP